MGNTSDRDLQQKWNGHLTKETVKLVLGVLWKTEPNWLFVKYPPVRYIRRRLPFSRQVESSSSIGTPSAYTLSLSSSFTPNRPIPIIGLFPGAVKAPASLLPRSAQCEEPAVLLHRSPQRGRATTSLCQADVFC